MVGPISAYLWRCIHFNIVLHSQVGRMSWSKCRTLWPLLFQSIYGLVCQPLIKILLQLRFQFCFVFIVAIMVVLYVSWEIMTVTLSNSNLNWRWAYVTKTSFCQECLFHPGKVSIDFFLNYYFSDYFSSSAFSFCLDLPITWVACIFYLRTKYWFKVTSGFYSHDANRNHDRDKGGPTFKVCTFFHNFILFNWTCTPYKQNPLT